MGMSVFSTNGISVRLWGCVTGDYYQRFIVEEKLNARSLERGTGCADGLVVDGVFDRDSDSTTGRVRTIVSVD